MNPIVKLAANALPGEKKYILFAGAGVSKDAGVPTAWDLMLKTANLLYAVENDDTITQPELEKWFTNSEYANMEYSELIEKIYPQSPNQQDFLNKFLNNSSIGLAHQLIAELARRNIIRAIITTNFDHYIEKALDEKKVPYHVISTEEDLINSEPLIHCKSIRIYKPHGNLGQGALKNTPKDLDSLNPEMEKELIRILSEHGVIIIGYKGKDKGIQKVFKERNYTHYPLFYVNPSQPVEEFKQFLETKEYNFIQYNRASEFLKDYLRIFDKITNITSEFGNGPSIFDISESLSTLKTPIVPLMNDYLKRLFQDLEKTKPDFTKFSEYDEAIYTQIENALDISYNFINLANLICKYKNDEAILLYYQHFGTMLKLYDNPPGFVGTYRYSDFDGFKFMIHEMFVSFIALLIKFDNWEILGNILNEDLFIDNKDKSKYVPFIKIISHNRTLDEIRKNRLNLTRISPMVDLIKERLTDKKLSEIISFDEYIEADYFLFMRTVCHETELLSLKNTWYPYSSIYLDWIPKFIKKSESRRYIIRILKATKFDTMDNFIQTFNKNHTYFTRFFKPEWVNDPLEYYDFTKLGTRE